MAILRNGGFNEVDLSVDILNHRKWRHIRRHHAAVVLESVVVYLSVVCDSWRAGKRLPIDECWPEHFVPETILPAVANALTSAGLLDKTGCIPEDSWDEWFGQADAHAEQHRLKSQKGGLAKAARYRELKAEVEAANATLTPEQQAEAAASKAQIEAIVKGLK